MGWKSKCKRAKKLHRPSHDNWECDGFYETFPDYVRQVLKSTRDYEAFLPFGIDRSRSYYRSFGELSSHDGSILPVRLDAKTLSVTEFHESYECNGTPCIIRGIPLGHCYHLRHDVDIRLFSMYNEEKKDDSRAPIAEMDAANSDIIGSHVQTKRWKALDNWTFHSLVDNDDLRNCKLKCGEDDDGHSVRLKLKHFLKYLNNNRDDSPLYIFDSTFGDDQMARILLDDYQVPSYFNEDLFHLVGEKRRPPYRWFLVGPERSGTCVHIDPLGTSAWNTLIVGKKRWVLFPPHVPKHIVKGSGVIYKGEDDEAVHYFTTILPRIKHLAERSGNSGDYKSFECFEFTQHERETVFIPCGWWHAVLNLTHTVGITQNYCSHRNFDQVWVKTRVGRKKMAYKWLCKLRGTLPHLAHRAEELNRRDNFKMKYGSET